jgi:hypothetical protein
MYHIPDSLFMDWDKADVHTVAECFVCHLRTDRGYRSTTIDQYVSHVINFYKENKTITTAASVRSTRLAMMITGYAKEDAERLPARLKEKIPLTAALMVAAYALILLTHGDANIPLAAALAGALSLGYALSLRPDEYLNAAAVADDAHVARGHKSFFKWPDDPTFYVVTRPADFPARPDPPTTFLTLLDDSKNDPQGHGAPRAVCAAPPGSPFCLVNRIFECLKRFPPTGSRPLFSGLPVSVSLVNTFLKKLAVHTGLDPTRLVPHSARVAAVIQLARHTQATQLRQGNWTTVAGMLAYARGSLEHAALVAADMHDTSLCTIEYLRLMCMTPSR